MVTICTKKFTQPTMQDRILSKWKKSRDGNLQQFLLEQKELRNSTVLSGTSVPNSTFLSLYPESNKNVSSSGAQNNINDNRVEKFGKMQSSSSLTSKKSVISSLKCLKNNVNGKEESSTLTIRADGKNRTASSIISSTDRLNELKEMRDLLYTSSYIPKQTHKARRPTIEKIKSAIEKEKQFLADKNESTINDSIILSDAATSTEKIRKKKRIKKVRKKSISNSSTNRSIGTNKIVKNSSKQIKVSKTKKKLNSKIDIEIQCSIFKVKSN